jgi:hypothetical protein
MIKRTNIVIVSGIVLMTLFQACGIYSFKGATLSPAVKTVSIRTFNNQASLVVPSLAEIITEKLKDKFLSELNLSLIEDQGDIRFSGSIVEYISTPSSIQSTDQAATSRLTVKVKVSFQNTREKEKDYDNTFTAFVDFDSNASFSAIEDNLIDEVTDILVQDIFNKAVNNW